MQHTNSPSAVPSGSTLETGTDVLPGTETELDETINKDRNYAAASFLLLTYQPTRLALIHFN